MKGSSSNVMYASNCHALQDKIYDSKYLLPNYKASRIVGMACITLS